MRVCAEKGCGRERVLEADVVSWHSEEMDGGRAFKTEGGHSRQMESIQDDFRVCVGKD